MDTRDITILPVDAEKKFLNTISEKIRLKGFEPLSALSGEEAIEIAKGMKIDIAIVDHKMPGMDCITTITKLKEIHPDLRTALLDNASLSYKGDRLIIRLPVNPKDGPGGPSTDR